MPLPPPPERVIGLDFSGSARAGEKIWLAIGALAEGRLCIERLVRAADLTDSSRERERCLPALRAFIVEQGRQGSCAIGCDFPFSLPQPLIAEPTWIGFVRGFRERYPSAEAFLAACRQATATRELRRRCDTESRTPFCACNLRLYRQTHAGIAELLAPLVCADAARVLPMQSPAHDRPSLLEVCPASTLKRIGWYLPKYKGRGPRASEARARILAALEQTGRLDLDGALREIIVAEREGDALDCVVAAFATADVFALPARHAAAGDPAYALEGYVYS